MKGFTCPNPACQGQKLLVESVRKPARQIIRRFRICPRCRHRETTEERPRVPRPADPQ